MTENNTDPIEFDEDDTVESDPAPAKIASKSKPVPTAPSSLEVSEPKDQVLLIAIQQNPLRRRISTSVEVLQRRLHSLGHTAVVADKPGILDVGTRSAIQSFQAESKLEVTDVINADTLTAIFKGDDTVEVRL